MSRKHGKILEAIFNDPVSANIKWGAIESLLKYHGAELSEGDGSRIRVKLNGRKAVFHRPHPAPDTDKGAVKSMRRFLAGAGVTP
ncbi:MAG: type II toxin-antitoxin system HicA family toxin [Gammaproteobacteria bacterium]|nr:type II toxin-antitoxin system HicA family toxin [Gammaproteobacteria bacterium]